MVSVVSHFKFKLLAEGEVFFLIFLPTLLVRGVLVAMRKGGEIKREPCPSHVNLNLVCVTP